MRSIRLPLIMTAMMLCAALAGIAGRAITPARDAPSYRLEAVVPLAFGDWREQRETVVALVNPQTQQLLDQLYSQLLNRTYVHRDGYRIMLSLAYGNDQRGGLQAHLPEVCYPAQGFEVDSQSQRAIVTSFGSIPARRLQTSLGSRKEPVTYWFKLGSEALESGSAIEKRLIELRFALTGQVADGLLFRVSSIDADPEHAFERQNEFVQALLAEASPQDRFRLSGLSP